VDLRSIQLNDGLSDQVIRAIQLRIERGEQSMLFLNRRGFAPVLYCPGCGWISPCKRCSSNMVVHLYQKTLHCHHCGTVEPIPSSCPECGELDLRPIGMGTQRLETNLSKLFPQARILRIDRDNTQGKNIFNQIFNRIAMGDVDIILGTQMLTKGHDFPKLTLVIILNADSMLFSSDFRAQERLFTQLMQVSGRSGRAHLAGEVLIQTSFPAHPIFRAVQSQDFSTFAHTLLSERKNLGFPPYTFLAVLKAEASELAIALRFLKEVQDMAKSSHSKVTIFDPVPTFMYRRKNREYAQLLMQANQRTDLHRLLSRLLRQLPRHKEVKWHIDIDPVEV
ncbi:MAG: primosomal protein N', partial [Pseudomonadota bacterium]|nr:primosomal protein N' [Pseudomonadota bacterium]